VLLRQAAGSGSAGLDVKTVLQAEEAQSGHYAIPPLLYLEPAYDSPGESE